LAAPPSSRPTGLLRGVSNNHKCAFHSPTPIPPPIPSHLLPNQPTPYASVRTISPAGALGVWSSQALRACSTMGIDWGVLTEAKLTAGIHTRFSSGYHVVSTAAPSATKGGITLFFRESTAFQVESFRRHGGNVISFMVVTGALRQGVVGCYIPPSDTDLQTLHHLNEAFLRFPPGHTSWVLGDINANIQSPHNEWQAAITTELLSRGLIDALAHFRQRRRFRDLCTWRQRHNSSLISSRCDYILLPDCSVLRSAGLQDPRYFSSDHLMVIGKHQGSSHSQGAAYIRGRKAFPLGTPKWGPMTQADFLFEKVLAQVQVPAHSFCSATLDQRCNLEDC
jgi:hypothetical protein